VTRRQGWAALAVAMAASGALLLWLQRDLTFVADEIPWLEWVSTEPVSSLLAPYNGNLHLSTLLGARVLLEAFGTDYLPYGLFQIAGLWLCAGCLYALAARRLGHLLGLASAAIVLFLGSGWAVLLQPLVGTVFVYSLGLGLAAILVLERCERRGDVAACVLLCVALSFYSAAIAFVAGAAVAIALAPEWRRRAWVVLVPVALYAGWRIAAHYIEPPLYAPEFGGEPLNLVRAPLYYVDSAALVAGAIFAGGIDSLAPGPATGLVLEGFSFGRLAGALALICLEVVVVGAAVVWLRRRGPVPRSVWVAVAMLFTLWTAQSYVLSVGRTAAESRYLFSGAFVMLILLIEVAAALRPSRRVAAVAVALLVIPVALNVLALRAPYHLLKGYAARDRADMAMVELADGRADPGFAPLQIANRVPPALYLTAGPWNELVAEHGSPSMSIAELERQSEAVREEADTVLAGALRLGAEPTDATPSRCKAGVHGGVLDPPGAVVTAGPRGAALYVRRFADRFGAQVGTLPPHTTAMVRVAADGAGAPWRLRGVPAARVCPLPPGSP